VVRLAFLLPISFKDSSMFLLKRRLSILMLACMASAWAQQDPSAAPPASPSAASPAPIQPGQTQEPPDKRVFGVLPNYRTANETAIYTPITTKQKFTIGLKDSFDYPLVLLAGAFAGLGQLTNQHPQFGQGLAGFGRRLGTGYADQAIGNMMTEAIFPSLLREDPRYFRRGYGSVGSRTWYALTRVMVTRTDSGGRRFNFSEWVGNATGVAISNAYYPDEHSVLDNAGKLVEQVGTDAISQVLKEFWPDIKHKLFHRHENTATGIH
jgi:hypothetical protein